MNYSLQMICLPLLEYPFSRIPLSAGYCDYVGGIFNQDIVPSKFKGYTHHIVVLPAIGVSPTHGEPKSPTTVDQRWKYSMFALLRSSRDASPHQSIPV